MSLGKPTITGPHNGAEGLGATPTIRGKADPDCVVYVYVPGHPEKRLGPAALTDHKGDWSTGITVPDTARGAVNSVTAQAHRDNELSDYADNVSFSV